MTKQALRPTGPVQPSNDPIPIGACIPFASQVRASTGRPVAQGMYDPAYEKDACGIGLIAHILGAASHDIVKDGLVMLCRMDHRGATGCEANTGDGAGIITAMPHAFLAREARRKLKRSLPEPGHYVVGNIFLPADRSLRQKCKQVLEACIVEQGQQLLGWRPVPTDARAADIGPSARATEPVIEQIFIAAADGLAPDAFERHLYVIRKRAFHQIRSEQLVPVDQYYVCSFSNKVIVYKGQLKGEQLMPYYPDLADPDYVSHFAMVHSRFSTNTFPSWERAQPMRYVSHNGEINTLLGNVNWMRAREGLMRSSLFGDDFDRLHPVIDPNMSDSGMFDNVLELLVLTGRSLPEAIMMMIPEAWENHETMTPDKRAFYEFHANLMEPWDGPASVAFTDGHYIGAVLDRNGLRPSRYYVTTDHRVIMASEVGVLDVPAELVMEKGRLQPGRMFLVDFEQGRVIDDGELKHTITTDRPYGQWLRNQRIELSHLPAAPVSERLDSATLIPQLQAFGYTTEHINMLMLPMAVNGAEAIGSMGNDAAHAVLSDKPRLLYDYFKQRFAQVTNPPIDPIREEIIMSLECTIGPEGNLLETTEPQCHRLHLPSPVLPNHELAQIKHIDHRGWRAKTLDMTYAKPPDGVSPAQGGKALTDALDRICLEATQTIDDGYTLIVLSDRQVGSDRVPISSLLAVGTVHEHLVSTARRTQIGIIVECGDAREVHHFCLLVGYGADAINPYLAFEALWQARSDGVIDPDKLAEEAIAQNYIRALNKGILKVMSKMGISTLASYKGAQIFEAVGLSSQVINRSFTGTASRIEGVNFNVIAEEALRRHRLGYAQRQSVRLPLLPNPGEYHWRSGGEQHAINPTTIASLQTAARRKDRDHYWQFAKAMNQSNRQRCTIRGLLRIKTDQSRRIHVDQVEPAEDIVKRFRTGAMSFGALSKEAHETLAVAMNRVGGKSNSGEGGEDYSRFQPLPNGDSRRSAIKQVASGRFGVTSYYLTHADVLQIKMAQGAKPGEGGQLPGFKVDQEIARVRHSTPGVGLISPPPHHDIYSIEDLAQLIYDLKNANPEALVSVKLVSEVGVGTIAAGVAKAHADHILISGQAGGTGASPWSSVKHAGLPWELGLAETQQTLVLNDLRSRVRLEVDGGMRTGRDVLIGALLGAEEFGFSTTPLIALGCIMMRKCHLNTCPVGICTQNPDLRKKFQGQPEHVLNYLFMVAEELRQYMAALGVVKLDDLIGRVEFLETDQAIEHWKAKGLDLAPILTQPAKPRPFVGVRHQMDQDHGLDKALDNELIARAEPALQHGTAVALELPIHNRDRAVGAMLSHRVSKCWGEHGLPSEDTVKVKFAGSAGQSFGAFLARGISFELEGDANDYVGKSLSGGKLMIYPPRRSRFEPEQNVIIGNVALYGAVEGYAFIRGIAAERFAVRNSGACAVIEGVGDHGCEYMTGGRVVVLGPTGRNFAAGMSGGVAYIWDQDAEFVTRCNLGMVDLEKVVEPEDIAELRGLIGQHLTYTGSTVAARLLADWDRLQPQLVKVMPIDYRRALEERRRISKDLANRREVFHGQ